MPDPYLTDVTWSGPTLRVAGHLPPDAARPAEARVLLRERNTRELIAVPAVLPASSGTVEEIAEIGPVPFEVAIDVTAVGGGAPLPGGLWDLELALGPPGESAAVLPLGGGRAPGLDPSPQRRFLPDSATVTAYFSAFGTLSIDVGGGSHAAGSTRADSLAWNEHAGELVVAGHIDFQVITMPISATLALRERGSDRGYEVIAVLEADPERLSYTASIPLTRAVSDAPLPRGTWEVFLVLGFSGMHREVRVMAPEHPVGLQVWRRLRHTDVSSTQAPDALSITVGRP